MHFPELLDSVVQDLRYGWRSLRRARGSSLAAVSSLSIAIGANLALYTVIETVYLRTLPVREPATLVQLQRDDLGLPSARGARFSNPVFKRLQQIASPEVDLFAVTGARLGWVQWQGSLGHDERINFERVSGGYFRSLGVNASLGRTFEDLDDKQGAYPVAVLSDKYWQRRFGRSPLAIGAVFKLEGVQFEVIGVTPAPFFGTEVGRDVDVWLPMATADEAMLTASGVSWISIFGRSNSTSPIEVTEAQLQAAFTSVTDDLRHTVQQTVVVTPPERLRVVKADRGSSHLRTAYERPMQIIASVVFMILLMACANVAVLLLTRAASREGELAVRQGLGARPVRIVRQLVTESLLLTALASLIGGFLAWASAPHLIEFLGHERLPVRVSVGLNWQFLGAAVIVCCFTTIFSGLWPALRAAQFSIDTALRRRSGTGASRVGTFRTGKFFAAAQLALSVSVLVTTMLLLITLWNLASVRRGFDDRDLLVVELTNTIDTTDPAQTIIWRQLVDRVSGALGIEGVALAQFGLFSGSSIEVSIRTENQTAPMSRLGCYTLHVSPQYFQTMRTQLLAGRTFESPDLDDNAPQVAIVNKAFVDLYLSDTWPLGRRFSRGEGDRLSEIVGVVEDVKFRSLREEWRPIAYFPLKATGNWMTMVIRSQLDPSVLTSLIHREAPAIRVERILFQQQLIGESIHRERLLARVSIMFSVLALLLASIGVFAVMSHIVSSRTRELGIRIALGAKRHTVQLMILRESLITSLIGLLAGVVVTVGATQLVRSLLFEVSAISPVVLGSAILLLGMLAMIASGIPAWRACKTDPSNALRVE